ncbi:MAG: thiamine pyrophosphate-dependent enzyme, partial [Thaumarchaeota archaeon]|nr:thiamine pyrophosphate-dependent enzyme [Nitrososphaerota archaeon]
REEWMNEWMPKLTSNEVPMSPYRVIWEFMKVVDPNNAIVTHDSGSPRDQIVPFYKSGVPRTYIGWGKSHALGSGLGFIMGAKLAKPERFCVNFMGDAAFGMTGLDFETAVRSKIPITTCVFNNSIMACEKTTLTTSHEKYGTRFIGGDYAGIGKDLGGVAERVKDPQEIGPAVKRAQQQNSQGKAVLIEFITSEETAYSERAEFLF